MSHFLCRMAVVFLACSVSWDCEVGKMRKNQRWKGEESVGRTGAEQEQHLFKARWPSLLYFIPATVSPILGLWVETVLLILFKYF